MRTRSFTLLVAGVILLGLIVAVVCYIAFPGFQTWVQVWIARPDGLAATATTVAALATLFAVVVGLRGIIIGRDLADAAYRQAEKAIKDNRNQFLQAQFNASRPLIVPMAGDARESSESEEPIDFDWTADYRFVTIQNVGAGPATNIWLTLLPPAPPPDDNARYSSRLGTPLVPGGEPLRVYVQHGTSLFDETDRLQEYGLYVPTEQATSASGRADRFIARLCLSYQDIFGRKHASIFDLSDRGVWVNQAFLSGIELDLADLNAAKKPSATPPHP